MKTKDLKLGDREFVITRMNAHDASYFCVSRLLPILSSLEGAVSGDSGLSSIANALGQLTRERYDEIINALFELVQVRQENHLFSVMKDGRWMYEDVRDESYIYLSLLSEGFMWSFGDFFDSVSRTFPGVLTKPNIQLGTKA